MRRRILLIIIIILIAIQFIRPAKNQSNDVLTSDISHVYTVPQNVSVILKKACNDCHTNNTVYPWYAQIQPVGWWLNHHIEEGKDELNFNEFGAYAVPRQYHKLEEVVEQVKEGEMPIWSYTLIHTNAKLTDEEKQTLINWAQGIRNTMKAKYPADSLVIKRSPEAGR
jgi:cytochrome c551/c552